MSAPGEDELGIRRWLCRRGLGTTPTAPAEQPTEKPERERDWFDRLYEDDQAPPAKETAAQGEGPVRWYSLNRRSEQTEEQPAVPTTVTIDQDGRASQIVISQPAAQQPAARHDRRRVNPMWAAYHGSCAFVGWWLGLEEAMRHAADAPGRAGLGTAIGLVIVTFVIAAVIRGMRIPEPLYPVVNWVARIPVCTAALALALHGPR
ncbi:hypothetical protein ABZ883_04850 [Streptomyces sp. NPDC046977]|uniref:hypothetical protein n=1 Tax=Streptomyces sp. NPDC046977 TaxID=3154703 RepID=UPI0033F55A1A